MPARNRNIPRSLFRIIDGTVEVRTTASKQFKFSGLRCGVQSLTFSSVRFTIRGYNVRSITPLAPLDTFITTKDVVVAANPQGTPEVITGLPANTAALGTFTGITGSNVARIASSFTPVGADTQLLGNFEYRVPVIGSTVQLAAFADIGTAFNLRSNSDQFSKAIFLMISLSGHSWIYPGPRSPIGAAAANLSAIAACNADTSLAVGGITTKSGLVMRAIDWLQRRRWITP